MGHNRDYFSSFSGRVKKKIHRQIYPALKKGGKLVLEAYNKNQIEFKTGGPMTRDLLYSKQELLEDFAAFENFEINELIRDVHEGAFHNGKAAVVQIIGEK